LGPARVPHARARGELGDDDGADRGGLAGERAEAACEPGERGFDPDGREQGGPRLDGCGRGAEGARGGRAARDRAGAGADRGSAGARVPAAAASGARRRARVRAGAVACRAAGAGPGAGAGHRGDQGVRAGGHLRETVGGRLMSTVLFVGAAEVVPGESTGPAGVRARVAVAVRGGEIAAVGAEPELTARFAGAERVDCAGCVVTPGFVDSHTHAVFG